MRQQAIIWINDGLIYWHIWALLGLNELTHLSLNENVDDIFNVFFERKFLYFDLIFTRTLWQYVNSDSGNGLVSLGTKSSPIPILTKTYEICPFSS